jgi:hypothetical protein
MILSNFTLFKECSIFFKVHGLIGPEMVIIVIKMSPISHVPENILNGNALKFRYCHQQACKTTAVWICSACVSSVAAKMLLISIFDGNEF